MSLGELPFSIPLEVQVSLIGAQLNSTIIFTFLTGLYSLVYMGTIYLHIFKLPTQRRNITVLSALSFLYALCLIQLGLQWYFTYVILILDGESRLSMFLGVLTRGAAKAPNVVFELTFCLMFITSDALLIWRCYHVWARSMRVVVLPMIFILAETGKSNHCPRYHTSLLSANVRPSLGLSITLTVLSTGQSEIADALTFKRITGPQVFVSFCTTAYCTVLIGYKIHNASKAAPEADGKTRSTFSHTIKVIVESAAIYSLVLLVYAIECTLPLPSDKILESPLLVEGYYIQPVTVFIAGMAPTVISARIALTFGPDDNEVDSNPSLYFSSIESRQRTVTTTDNETK